MEVTNVTNIIAAAKPTPAVTPETGVNEGAKAEKTAEKKIDKNYDPSEAVMNVEELQDYLFMLMGLPSPGKSDDTGKGVKINLVA